MRVLELIGEPYAMGQQHGEQVVGLRSEVVAVIQRRLASLDGRLEAVAQEVEAIRSVWEKAASPTLEMMRGMEDVLGLGWERYLRYTLAGYLEGRLGGVAEGEGCTVWAAAGAATSNGATILAKNRDYHSDHHPLQCFVRARPSQGHRYGYVTSAGSPGVFSSGMNEAGLAVADTHVPTSRVGPGVARYSAMMDLLERYDDVPSALNYLGGLTHIGDGTLVLADTSGRMAIFEGGDGVSGVIRPNEGFVVSTNHFETEALRRHWVDRNPPSQRGHSQMRQARVRAALQSADGQVDGIWAQGLMAEHAGDASTVCRHPQAETGTPTISTAIYLPAEGRVVVADGQPCRSPFKSIDLFRPVSWR